MMATVHATVTAVPSTPPALYAEHMADLGATYLTGQNVKVTPDSPYDSDRRMTIAVWDIASTTTATAVTR
jgi:hypothetical protein